ncbi:uncharacterized protein LOC121812673 [Haplochromis burtoni]|uniref:uncharacterized protein LOC121812673 n=1 Tax=Haplochromis burtoni TaxID=8153 RepID=UPI001C2DD51B|nr:uncharacterized protein LOC121812673 [Haplochromis burtoni]
MEQDAAELQTPRQNQGKRETVDLARCAAAFAIGVREQCHLSQRSVNNIVLGVQQYQTALLTSLRGKIKTILERQPDSNGPLQQEVLSTLDNFQDPFPICAASNLQDRVTQMHFNPVTPEEILISKYACRVKKGESRVLAIKNKSFYYIPLIESLKQLLSNSRLFDMLSAGPQSCPNASFLYDINDGIIFKTHPLFSENSALQLILCSDEIEMCNPLGSRASVNKLLMFYYTLGNIDPKFRSKLASIKLLAIAKSRDIDECGVDIILRRINEDLKLLYDGVMINTVNGEFYLNRAVVAVCGDTLAQHELAGFKEGVGLRIANVVIEDELKLQQGTTDLRREADKIGLRISSEKIMHVSSKDPRRGIYIGTQQLEEVEKFTYLGSMISLDGDAEVDVKCRIGKAAAVFRRMNNEEILRRSGTVKLHNIVARKRLRLAGHILRMDDTQIPKTAMHWQPLGVKRPQGHPRNTWRRSFHQDLKTLNIYRWKKLKPGHKIEPGGVRLPPDMPHKAWEDLSLSLK